MPARRTHFLLATLAIYTTVWAAEKADFGKRKVEAPTKNVLTESAGLPAPPRFTVNSETLKKPRLDVGKGRIERATERLLVDGAQALRQSVAKTGSATPAFENPKVEPGKVRWHTNFDAARAASGKSLKPVLLFQMMGNLDDRFC